MAANVHEEPSEDVVASAKRDRAARRNPFSRIWLFLKQVFDELSKVVTPTRKELINLTLVVLVFVLIMLAIISLLDAAFGALVLWMFSNTTV